MGFLKARLGSERDSMKLSRPVEQPEKHYRPKPQERDSALSDADRTGMLVPCKMKATVYSLCGQSRM